MISRQWDSAFEALGETPSGRQVLVTVPIGTPSEQLQSRLSLLFEKYGVSQVSLQVNDDGGGLYFECA